MLAMPTKELRFAVDEKGYKTLAPTLVGQTIAYWEGDSHLLSGRVIAAEVKRDRYGNPYIEVEFGAGVEVTPADGQAAEPPGQAAAEESPA